MSRLAVARQIANQTGSSVSNTLRWVNDVGTSRAQRTLNRVEDGVTWRVPATVIGGSGGVYYWREQNIREAEAIADQQESAADALASIIDSDLPDDLKAELAHGFEGGSNGGSDGDGPADRVSSFLDGLGDMFGGTETTLILMIVVVFVLIYALNSLNPAMQGGVVR